MCQWSSVVPFEGRNHSLSAMLRHASHTEVFA